MVVMGTGLIQAGEIGQIQKSSPNQGWEMWSQSQILVPMSFLISSNSRGKLTSINSLDCEDNREIFPSGMESREGTGYLILTFCFCCLSIVLHIICCLVYFSTWALSRLIKNEYYGSVASLTFSFSGHCPECCHWLLKVIYR